MFFVGLRDLNTYEGKVIRNKFMGQLFNEILKFYFMVARTYYIVLLDTRATHGGA